MQRWGYPCMIQLSLALNNIEHGQTRTTTNITNLGKFYTNLVFIRGHPTRSTLCRAQADTHQCRSHLTVAGDALAAAATRTLALAAAATLALAATATRALPLAAAAARTLALAATVALTATAAAARLDWTASAATVLHPASSADQTVGSPNCGILAAQLPETKMSKSIVSILFI